MASSKHSLTILRSRLIATTFGACKYRSAALGLKAPPNVYGSTSRQFRSSVVKPNKLSKRPRIPNECVSAVSRASQTTSAVTRCVPSLKAFVPSATALSIAENGDETRLDLAAGASSLVWI
eukprot:774694-Amphidinium_carterae.1